MYNPKWFREDRIEVLHAQITKISFGTLITYGASSGILATHIPIMLDATKGQRGTLFGHIACRNPQWRETPPNSEALAVFLGPGAYITPRWYQTKKQNGRVVPTWNYITIHARGPITFFEDSSRLRQTVATLTDLHESAAQDPWKVDDAPTDYIENELKSIVGFEVPISKIEGKWKMSQNRPDADRAGVISGLEERDLARDQDVSAEMRRRDNNPSE